MKKILKLIAITGLLSFVVIAPALAAIINSTIEGIDSELIESFTLVLDVDDNFTLNNSSFGDAVPDAVGGYGWGGDVVVTGNTLTIANANYDYLLASLSNPLKDGQLFSLDFDGSIIGFSDIYFFDATGINYFDVQIENLDTWIADGSVSFIAGPVVPIPSALFLLGGGLLGFVGIRRKVARQ